MWYKAEWMGRPMRIELKPAAQFLEKYMYLSLYWKGSKRVLKVLQWEGVGDRTELQHTDPHSYGHQRCVFLVLQRCSTGGPRAQLSAGW